MTAQADDQDGDGGGVRLQATARHRRPARRRPRRRHALRRRRAGTHGQEEPVGGRLRHVDLRTLSPPEPRAHSSVPRLALHRAYEAGLPNAV